MRFLRWLIVRLRTRLLVLSNADQGAKDHEIGVLRQQLSGAAPQDRPPTFTAPTEPCWLPPAGSFQKRWAWLLVATTPGNVLVRVAAVNRLIKKVKCGSVTASSFPN
jgi:hypothetical protein